MKKLYFILALLLPFSGRSQKSYTYTPFFPRNIEYHGDLAVTTSKMDSSSVACCYDEDYKGNLFIVIKSEYKKLVIAYEDIKINDGRNVPIYTANELIEKLTKKFNSRQTWGAIAAAYNANSTEHRSTTISNYTVTSGYTKLGITGKSTTVSNDPDAAIEKMKMHHENMEYQTDRFDVYMENLKAGLLYLPSDDNKISGSVYIRKKLTDEFTVTIKIGDDIHKFKFRKTRK